MAVKDFNNQILFKYCNEKGQVTRSSNPNGSIKNIAGVCNKDRNVFGMMPHPERAFLSYQHSWCPEDWEEYGPWMKFFLNAREFVD